MAEVKSRNGAELAKPKVGSGFSLSPIWIFPIVALAIGGWLVFQTLSQKGPTITISFETADGIEEGKTKVKYREVEIGLVKAVRIKDDLSGVIVTAEMKNEAERFLTKNARFWVVRPRLGAQGVSGLGTIVSGAFIEVDPGRDGEAAGEFAGLEVPPVITTDEPGKDFLLVTENLGSYSTGSPVYYRGLEVGEILGNELAENQKEFRVHVFVREPHDKLVRKDTRFWNVSGVNVSIDADGMELNVESLRALALGGVAFDTKGSVLTGTPSKAGSIFRLHDTKEDVDEADFTQTFRWIAYFEGSVRGLVKNAPVEFKDIRVGRVVDVRLEVDRETGGFRIPVLLDIEPERVTVSGEAGVDRAITLAQHYEGMQRLISTGLKARLKSGSLITGQLLVELDFYPEEKAVLRGDNGIPELPTIPSSIEEITRSLTALVDKIQSLPLNELAQSMTSVVKSVEELVNSKEIPSAIKSLDQTLATLNRVLNNVDKKVSPQAEAALTEAYLTMKTIREASSQGAPLRYNLETTLEELAAAARSIRLGHCR